MIRMSRYLIGGGFCWMFLWTIFGGLLGAKINASAVAADPSWLSSWERTLFRTAHAHMGTMALTVILAGLALPRLGALAKDLKLNWAVALLCLGPVFFGTGLILEALRPPNPEAFHWPMVVTVLGAFGYMIAIAQFGVAFLIAARRET